MVRLRSLDPLELKVLTQFANGQSTDWISASLGRHKSVLQSLLRVARGFRAAALSTRASNAPTQSMIWGAVNSPSLISHRAKHDATPAQ